MNADRTSSFRLERACLARPVNPLALVADLWVRLKGPRRLRTALALAGAGLCSLYTCLISEFRSLKQQKNRGRVLLIAYTPLPR